MPLADFTALLSLRVRAGDERYSRPFSGRAPLGFFPSKAFPVCTMRWLVAASPPFRFAPPPLRKATLRFGVSLVQKVASSSREDACLPEVPGHVFLTMQRFDALAY